MGTHSGIYGQLKRIIYALGITLASVVGQAYAQVVWDTQGQSYFRADNGNIVRVSMPGQQETVWLEQEALTKGNRGATMDFSRFSLSVDLNKILLFGQDKRVFHNTYSTCWVYDRSTLRLSRVGGSLGASQLLNAKLSPDGTKVAYVYRSNIYVENTANGDRRQLTFDGHDDSIRNGWFDYVTSEELFLTDGFQWSPDGKHIAFWRMDISEVPIHYMINNTDSVYPQLIPYAFSKPGEAIAKAKIGIVTLDDGTITWVDLPDGAGDHYIPQIGWHPDSHRLMVQQLNRRQDVSRLFCYHLDSRAATLVYEDRDEAWVDIQAFWMRRGHDWYWVDNGNAFIWASEKSGWRKLYRITLDGDEQLLTVGDFDVMRICGIDHAAGLVYYLASPDNATQRYLYRASLDGKSAAERVTPDAFEGTNNYSFSPDGKWALHDFSSHRYLTGSEWLAMPGHTPLDSERAILARLEENPLAKNITFFTVTTADGVKMDGWMVKPKDFDPGKKYPVIFSVYTEPAGSTVSDVATVGASRRGSDFFDVDSGYIFLSVEGRGTPIPKGRAWRKAIYGNLGWVNVIDQAEAARKILDWPFIDKNRVAVFGGSGGGSTTLHLLFRYPEIYKVGMAASSVPSHFIYNNIYQERYLGLLPESRENYIRGSALTYAKGLNGKLLIVHGTGDHNVHYQGEELLINELIKHNKQFQFVPYPNRGHGITEGEGTTFHRKTLYRDFLYRYCPPGSR